MAEINPDYADWSCEHRNTELRRYTASNGVIHVRRQCLRCGRATEILKRKNVLRAISSLPEWDDELSSRFSEQVRATRQQAWDQQQRIRKIENERANELWWERYNTYLDSEEWAAIRDQVLQRAGGFCEGCGKRRAVHVHHLTYDHVCEEFLFELVALCRACHQRLHPNREMNALDELEWRGVG